MKKAGDNNKICAANLTDLSKALDCLLNDLVIVKLQTFRLDYQSLKTIYVDLSEGCEIAKVDSLYGQISSSNLLYVTDLSVTPGNTVFHGVQKKTGGTERVTT